MRRPIIFLAWLLIVPFVGQSIAFAQSAHQHAEKHQHPEKNEHTDKHQNPETDIPIADANVYYSQDSVELTPPKRVIELMRQAGLKFALVSSSDDSGTQLLSQIAPDLVVPSLRPYHRREQIDTWFTDLSILDHVEDLLEKNEYASIGEFHLFGADADSALPVNIVHLADKHNLILHAHSDTNAINRLLAQNSDVKVLWAHAGFESPENIGDMLDKHDRLWVELSFRSEVSVGKTVREDWQELFKAHPERIMLGTDTYIPERMYYIPEHARSARAWLATLPPELAENLAWKNAHRLIMPVWKANSHQSQTHTMAQSEPECRASGLPFESVVQGENFTVLITPLGDISVGEPFSVDITVCSELPPVSIKVDAGMPGHGHGMNYTLDITELSADVNENASGNQSAVNKYRVEGMMFHMPGQWQWSVDLKSETHRETLAQPIAIQ